MQEGVDLLLTVNPIPVLRRPTMTRLIVNGQTRSFSFAGQAPGNSEGVQSSDHPATAHTPMTVAQLLEQMGLQGKRIAVERNGEIVPRSTFDQPLLIDGDRLEIVVAVGGG